MAVRDAGSRALAIRIPEYEPMHAYDVHSSAMDLRTVTPPALAMLVALALKV